MGRPWDCRCPCPHILHGTLNTDATGFDLIGEWNSSTWPPPWSIDTETHGGAVINSYTLERTPHYHAPAGFTYTAAQLKLDVTAPAGRWNAWAILWLPDSTVPAREVLDINDPDGIVRLRHIRSALYFRVKRLNREYRSGPRPVCGLVIEYDGQRYYHPHAYLTLEGDRVTPERDPENPLVPFRCWRPVPSQNDGKLINLSTLDYDDPAISYGCNPDPVQVDRVGLVVGMTTIGETADLDRESSGHITTTLGLSFYKAGAYYVRDCSCWWDPPIPTLTATFTTAPPEIAGDSLTLTRQTDGTFTGASTFGVDSLPYSITYTPCVSLVLTFPDCGLTMTFLHQTVDENLNGLTSPSQWQPIDISYSNRVCYDGTVNQVPDCGLSTNTTLPVGSPPFQTLWDCFLFVIRLEE